LPNIIVNGQVIEIPATNADPNWAQGIVQALEQLALAVNASIGTFDVAPQRYNMVANVNNDVNIPNLAFSSDVVRSAVVTYSIFRATDSANEAETGTLELIYNGDASPGSKWEMSRTFTGSSTVTFMVDDNGQISFSSELLAGSDYQGNIVFKGSALQQEY